MSVNVSKWRKKVKLKLITALGGRCVKCGYYECLDALDFHHKDSNDKEFAISKGFTNPKKWDILVDEVRKCVLLCCRCHRELHYGLWDLNSITIPAQKDLELTSYKKDTITGQCPICNKDVYNTKACSRSCAAMMANKIDWPDRKQLQDMLKKYTKAMIGSMLGVSETAVRKRIKKYKI